MQFEARDFLIATCHAESVDRLQRKTAMHDLAFKLAPLKIEVNISIPRIIPDSIQ
jgi:hypothetical protein